VQIYLSVSFCKSVYENFRIFNSLQIPLVRLKALFNFITFVSLFHGMIFEVILWNKVQELRCSLREKPLYLLHE